MYVVFHWFAIDLEFDIRSPKYFHLWTDETGSCRPTKLLMWMTRTAWSLKSYMEIPQASLEMESFTGLSMGLSCLVYWLGAVAVGFHCLHLCSEQRTGGKHSSLVVLP